MSPHWTHYISQFVPDQNRAIPGAREEHASVATGYQRSDTIAVKVLPVVTARSTPWRARALHIPGADRVVRGAGEELPPIGADAQHIYIVTMPPQLSQFGLPFHVPYA